MPAHIKALGQAEEHTYEGVVEASQPPAALPSPPAPRPPPNRSLEFDAQVDPPADAAAAAPAQEEHATHKARRRCATSKLATEALVHPTVTPTKPIWSTTRTIFDGHAASNFICGVSKPWKLERKMLRAARRRRTT